MESRDIDIVEITKKYKITQEEFGEMIGVSRKTIINYKKSGQIPRTKWEVLDKTINDLEDKMRKGVIFDDADPIELHPKDHFDVTKRIDGTTFSDLGDGNYLMTMPLVEPFAYAGYLTGFMDAEFIEELPRHSMVVQKQHFGLYRGFRVKGSSMDNDRRHAICEGDVVAGRQIDKRYWSSKFHLHRFEDYVIVHNDGIVVKRIINHDVEKGIITCHSLNEDKEAYPDFDLFLGDVIELYNIVSVESKRT